ncbi:grasp-with-spasm system ATP-grasp peptide maturase [Mucilaginibacter sp. CSA2-8R]|uniref:grasp-with-spasm system ATP-grasp peptide maturase n=1 Tax=Mucilaginibacter sp. CSA2-8R TaxID=3141542 RepID=UPI00315DFBAD
MILIISQSYIDAPTDYVYDWLKCLGVPCRRLNGVDLIKNLGFGIRLGGGAEDMQMHSGKINLQDISAVWIRRWITHYEFTKVRFESEEEALLGDVIERSNSSPLEGDKASSVLKVLADDINEHIDGEFRGLSHYFFEFIKDKPTLGNRFYAGKDPSKAHQLLVAAKVGLSVPATLITDSKVELQAFKTQYKGIICKNIADIGFFHFISSAATYTHLLTDSDIEALPESFFPTLFQQSVDKEFEIRAFVLGEEIYSMAIFSSKDERTEVDFRRYNHQNPNRNIPFKLPAETEIQIKNFMKLTGLQTGSIDLIYSKTGEFVFLEVNPVGQFSMVSTPCNYRLEKKVAEHLINLSQNGRN